MHVCKRQSELPDKRPSKRTDSLERYCLNNHDNGFKVEDREWTEWLVTMCKALCIWDIIIIRCGRI